MNGKGSRRRPEDAARYRQEHERILGPPKRVAPKDKNRAESQQEGRKRRTGKDLRP